MKNLLLIPILLCLFSKLNAQYIPLVAEHKYWFYERVFDIPDVGPAKPVSAYVLTFKGDTTIAGKSYKKVLEQELEGKHHCQHPPCFRATIPYKITSEKVIGYMNEDPLKKKVSFLPLNKKYCQKVEHEIFDFSMKKGDTLNFCMTEVLALYHSKFKLAIDSVKYQILFGKNRNTLFTIGVQTSFDLIGYGREEITEGVGYERFGLLYCNDLLEHFFNFCEGSLKDCEFSTATKNIETAPKLRVFPNPATDKIFIETEEKIKKISVYNSNGNLLSIENQSNTIDISTFANGFYFMKIEFENRSFYYHKFLKY